MPAVFASAILITLSIGLARVTRHLQPPIPVDRDRLFDVMALVIMVLLAGILLFFYDVTLHGADQIRDMEVARNLVRSHIWPVDSPPMFGEQVRLPPAFYYLLALPLWIHDSEGAVFIFFALLFILSAGFLWREMSRSFGPRYGLAYVVFAFPVFASVHAHSAWNPALAMTLSNVWLALFVRAIESRNTAWLALPCVVFVLLQVHPSAAPLLLGLGMYVAVHRKVLTDKVTLLTVAGIIGLTALWAVHSDAVAQWVSLQPQGAVVERTSFGEVFTRLSDTGKWRDALLMPYGIVRGIQPAIPGLAQLTGVHLLAMLVGGILGCGTAIASLTFRWVLLSAILWFVAAMAVLAQGSFWHLYVIYPWLAVLAAMGWGRWSERAKLSPRMSLGVGAGVAVLAVAGHLVLYVQFANKGNYDLSLSRAFFPRAWALAEYKVPAYTYRYLREVRDALVSHGICSRQVVGMRTMVLQDMNLRAFEVACEESSAKAAPGYFFAHDDDRADFEFTASLQPLQRVGGSAIYAVDPVRIGLGGQAVIAMRTDHRVNYMTYAPARLEEGLVIDVPPHDNAVLLRVALRCLKEHPVMQAVDWRLQLAGGEASHPAVKSRQHKYLGSIFYDLEWRLQPGPSGAVLSSVAGPLECDVSAIARRAEG